MGDLTLSDMLHAAVLRSQHAHARLRDVDVVAARRCAWRGLSPHWRRYRRCAAGPSYSCDDRRACVDALQAPSILYCRTIKCAY